MTENHTYDEIHVGDAAHLLRTLSAEDIQLFAALSGDLNPAQLDADYAKASPCHGVVANGLWAATLVSAVLSNEYPGPGAVWLEQTLHFVAPVHVGDTMDVRVRVVAKNDSRQHITLDCHCSNQHGAEVMNGTALLLATSEKIRRERIPPMRVRLADPALRYHQLLALVKGLPPITVAVVHPCSKEALFGAIEAAEMGLIVPVLVGPVDRIRALAAEARIDLLAYRLVDAPHSHAAAALAVKLACDGEVQALMKGSLHTDELMAEVVKTVDGLRTGRRISHVFALDIPSYPKPLLISDGAINVEPDLETKADIVRNAIDLAHVIGIAQPRVAILAAVETVNPKMRSTLDAAALYVMASRGQITGGIVDGPLAFDDAISQRAAQDKGIVSRVAGQADILIAPDLEAANMIVKQLQYLADARAAGVVLGARVPLILTSRADDASARVASCALALLLARAATSTSTAAASAVATAQET